MSDTDRDGNYATEQEAFWAGRFGDDYADRNSDAALVASSLARFSAMFRTLGRVTSILECGANVGLNLVALRQFLPTARLSAIEINAKAVEALKALGHVDVAHDSLLTHSPKDVHDFVFTSGVLIHIEPNALPKVYDLMHRASRRYIAVAEYYNPTPLEIPYRGHRERMYKRDFAGELMDRFSDLRLVDYGFAYRRDNNFTHDDLTWFVLEKSGA